MSTVTREKEIIAYIKIELSLVEDKLQYYQMDMDLKKNIENYSRIIESLTNEKSILNRLLQVSENLIQE